MVKKYIFNFVVTPRNFIIARLSIRLLLAFDQILLALMKIRAYGSKVLLQNLKYIFISCFLFEIILIPHSLQ